VEDASGDRVREDLDRLLICAPNWIGDVVLSLAAVRDLRRDFPKARVEVLGRPWVAELYRAVSEVDAVLESRGFRQDVERLRGAFDAAVLLPNSFRAALEVFMAGVPERWGYATECRGLLLTRGASVPAGIRGSSQVYYYRAMLSGVGLRVSASPDVSLSCPTEWADRGSALLGPLGPFVGMNAGAFYGTAKRWIPERYAAVGDRLSRRTGARVVILGGSAERSLAESIASIMQTPARVLCGETTLGDLVGVLSRLQLLITNDSGPMHIAAALGVPVLALFGPTDWRETAPLGPRHRIVREGVECAPCLLRECPIDHRCMKRISVDRVAREAEEILLGDRP
jgi:heptosyltransferase-2